MWFSSLGILITAFLGDHQIVLESHETRIPPGKPISHQTLLLSNVYLSVTAHPARLRTHTVEIVPSDDETPSTLRAGLSTLTAIAPAVPDPAVTAAITALAAHMDMIHKDLIERIGHVHERVDCIAERQEHDIKAIQDTLSALSQRHTEFITDVNTFI
ncbi:hypothetical protein Acr_00g0056630 [Actinidia rufa]|uniref:Uncharacterized protein n=1 Tax=Actinidia rufa TaxID=165716 RepID=A0A7J0DPB0_9ERIC|nr:hypothetical protein Acr_00g0056630 [Actinidia rufa]